MSAGRAAVRGTGEVLITAGLVLLLFCAYQLVWTNVEARRAQGRVTDDITEEWRHPVARGTVGDRASAEVDFGEGFAFLRIPRLGADFTVPVVEGVGESNLARGVGHYPDTAMPGAIGNFAVAGHRATHGEPFRDLDQVRPGDAVVVEVRDTWFTYVVDGSEIVEPTDTWVIDPVPGRGGDEPTRRLLTLTTCNPRWASTQRLIVFAHLQGRQPKSDGPPAVLAARRR